MIGCLSKVSVIFDTDKTDRQTVDLVLVTFELAQYFSMEIYFGPNKIHLRAVRCLFYLETTNRVISEPVQMVKPQGCWLLSGPMGFAGNIYTMVCMPEPLIEKNVNFSSFLVTQVKSLEYF